MDRKEQIAEMKRSVGGSSYIRRNEVAAHLGYKDPHNIDKYLDGLERIGMAYFIPDVVDSIRGSERLQIRMGGKA